MINLNTWSIDQHGWDPKEQDQAVKQMVFSNDYLCQSAHIEEHYASQQTSNTYVKGIRSVLPNLCAVSIRLHDEQLDLSQWQIANFYRCLHRDNPLLERRFTATDPAGNKLSIEVIRQLSTSHHERFNIHYRIHSDNYSGPISILPQLGGEEKSNWYPLQTVIDQNYCSLWLQSIDESIQVCCAMDHMLMKNNVAISKRPIKVDKRHIIGFSHTITIEPNDDVELIKRVVVIDSRQYPCEELVTIARQCLINW